MPYAGRGGAGNIAVAAAEADKVAAAAAEHKSPLELEANEHAGLDGAADGATTTTTARERQPYAHMGRGGAGNYYSPVQLSLSGIFSNKTPAPASTASATATAETITSASTPASATSPTAAPETLSHGCDGHTAGPLYAGRGGAGNYRGEVVEGRGVEGERNVGKVLRVEVERDVEMGLEKPEQAWLGGREVDPGRSEM